MHFSAEFLITFLVAAVFVAGCGNPTVPTPNAKSVAGAAIAQPEIDPIYGHLTHAQPRLPTAKVRLGAEEMIAEIARTELQIRTGMMFRTNMAENEAMIFVYPPELIGPKNFYTRNCVVPLSAAYITPDGTIAEITDLPPGNPRGVPSKNSNLQFVLEVPQGWFTRHNVRPGMVIRTEHGSLQETFFGR
jgi:uncharacterized membrane protein (UPF0127 family)